MEKRKVPTVEERREVAERLRGIVDYTEYKFADEKAKDWSVNTLSTMLRCIGLRCSSIKVPEAFARLADLIDPPATASATHRQADPQTAPALGRRPYAGFPIDLSDLADIDLDRRTVAAKVRGFCEVESYGQGDERGPYVNGFQLFRCLFGCDGANIPVSTALYFAELIDSADDAAEHSPADQVTADPEAAASMPAAVSPRTRDMALTRLREAEHRWRSAPEAEQPLPRVVLPDLLFRIGLEGEDIAPADVYGAVADLIEAPACRFDCISNEPAQDGQPVRRHECSRCGHVYDVISGTYRYCPWCGSRVVDSPRPTANRSDQRPTRS